MHQWVTPNPNADAKKRSSPRKSSQWLSAVTRVDANTTATVKPLSPAWHCLSEAGHSIPQRLRLDVDPCRSVPSRISRAVSPLARFAPVTADEIEAEQEIEDHFNCFVYSDDSDTASDWSARE
ncbi:uncharacterized protein PHACADRAFT_252628 [Phanerochaete carnosa HHB-10118-sp]|uniref:Uncharacterized protein n=1 Tax=Phanerochaete carnosa (strain HHB-10118-sp) TaxID=650164 RepID=K5X6A1_PHACS|nr:uncharacterized protein PHACADRAFT_252628 [Phanerochaete carnosa HHB-10118-sp]EKM58367.1 hypothetical protein PHACADRAFT_252628 [Phanerochaete carnosa HHB-10118-sp]